MWHRMRASLNRLNLTQQFRLASLLVLLVGLAGIGFWIQRQIEEGIIHGTASTTALYVESFVAPQLEELAAGKPVSPEHLQTLANLLQETPLGEQIIAFKLWGPNGFVLYDTDQSGIGKTFPVEPRLAQAWQGQTTSRISNLESDENVGERQIAKQLLETYSPVHLGHSKQIVAVAEFYQKVDELRSDIATAQRLSWLVVAGAMVIIYLLLSGFVQRASTTIEQQQAALTDQVARLEELLEQNEELHRRVRRGAAQTAALNERFLRRISAELHDGPAQEISLALLRIDPGGAEVDEDGQDVRSGPWNGETAAVRGALKHALQEIRAISAGLGLPELDRMALPDAIQRVVRTHERRTNTRVDLDLQPLPDAVPLAVKITAYRLIQEALSNAYRHAGAAGQAVHVGSENGELQIVVSDQGPGFDATQAPDGEVHLGLLGMRERVQSLGGIFRVDSQPGQGTRVVAGLPLGVQEKAHGR